MTLAIPYAGTNFKNVIFFLTLIFQNSIHSLTAARVLQVGYIEQGRIDTMAVKKAAKKAPAKKAAKKAAKKK